MRWVIALVLAGCDQLLGLPDIHPIGQPITVTGRYVASVVGNNSQHLPTVTDEPFPSITASVRLEDGSAPEVAWNADGTFSFPAHADQPYALRVVGNGATMEWQLAAPTLDLVEPVYSRLDRVAPAGGTTVAYNLSQTTPASSSVFAYATGQWGGAGLGGGASSSFMLDWTRVFTTPSVGTLAHIGLLDASRYDRLFLAIFEQTAPTYWTLTNYRSDDTTLVSGMETTISGPYSALAPSTCVTVNALRAAEADRLTVAGYGATFSGDWGIEALPAPQLGFNGGALLAFNSDGGQPTDVINDVQTANPFDGHQVGLYMVVTTTGNFLHAPGAMTGLEFDNSSFHEILAAGACPTRSTMLGVVALPGQPSLEDTPLAGDGTPITLDRTRPANLVWPTSSRNYDRFLVVVYELYTDTSLATQSLVVAQIWTVQPQASIDPALLEAGKTYLVAVSAQLDHPMAADGDFRTLAYPLAKGIYSSHTFTIAN